MPFFKERRTVMIGYGGKLNADVGNDIMIRLPGIGGDYRTTLVGMHPFDFLILKLPPVPGLKDSFIKGNEVTARYLHRGVVYGFTSHVLGVASSPCSLLFMAYPDQHESLSLRKNARIQCLIPCSVYDENGAYSGYIIDLGTGGCRINFEASHVRALSKLPTESDLYVEFIPCGGDELFILKSILRHVISGDDKISLGLQFTGISPDQQRSLSDFVEKISRVY